VWAEEWGTGEWGVGLDTEQWGNRDQYDKLNRTTQLGGIVRVQLYSRDPPEQPTCGGEG
jgi:hypothetical protein